MLTIKISDTPVPKYALTHNEKAVFATLKINDFDERISLVLDSWGKADYIAQWVDAINRIIGGATSAALVTQLYSTPNDWYAVECWPLYRDGEKVFVQNMYLPSERFTYPITIEQIYGATEDRNAEVSEWTCSVADLVDLKNTLEGEGE